MASVVEAESSPSEACIGALEFAFSEEGFAVNAAPTELRFRLENIESGPVLEDTLTVEYVDDNPDCPHQFAEITVEPVGMRP